MTAPKLPKVDVAVVDQAHTVITTHMIPHYAAVFRAFCAEEDVTRPEALILTVAYIQRPMSPSS